MSTRNSTRTFRIRTLEAVVGSGLFGALLAGGLINLESYEVMMHFGWLLGADSIDVAWLVFFGLGVLFAAPFAVVLEVSLESLVSKLASTLGRVDVARRALRPVLERHPKAFLCWALGGGYGLALGVGFHLLVVPLWLTYGVGEPTPVPLGTVEAVYALVGWHVYGSMMGLVYGVTTAPGAAADVVERAERAAVVGDLSTG